MLSHRNGGNSSSRCKDRMGLLRNNTVRIWELLKRAIYRGEPFSPGGEEYIGSAYSAIII